LSKPVDIYVEYDMAKAGRWTDADHERMAERLYVQRERVAVHQRFKENLGSIDVEKVDLNVLEAFCVALAAWKQALDPSLGAVTRVRSPRKPKAVA
jgi:hypothetical protein